MARAWTIAAAVDVLFADPNIARDAIWHAGGVGAGTEARVITKRPDQVVGFGEAIALHEIRDAVAAVCDCRYKDCMST